MRTINAATRFYLRCFKQRRAEALFRDCPSAENAHPTLAFIPLVKSKGGLVGSSGTARSICPAINASSISLTNRPLAADLGEQPVPAPGRRPCGSSRSRPLRSRPVRGEPRPNDRGRRWSGAAPSGCRGFRYGDGGTALTFLLAARSTPLQQWFQRPVSRHFHWSALCG